MIRDLKHIGLVLVALFMSVTAFAYGQGISYTDDQILKLLKVADTLRARGNFQRSLELSEEAEKSAKNLKNLELQAMALNRQGKALMGLNKKADSKFEKSNEYLIKLPNKNQELILDNFNQLRAIALARGNKKEVADIDFNINRIKKGQTLEQLDQKAGNLKDDILAIEKEKERLENEKAQLEADKAKMNQVLEEQKNIHSTLESEQAKLKRESKLVQSELAKKKAEIENMTMEQMRADLEKQVQERVIYEMRAADTIKTQQLKMQDLTISENKNKKRFYIATTIALLGLFGTSLLAFLKSKQNAKLLAEKNKVIEHEKERSDNLLLNILPASVADELKTNGFTKANHFEEVTVCFADFVGFTTIAGVTDPQKLIGELNTCFRAFDEIIAKYDLEKIKTIGDCYMFAGGLPEAGKGSQIIEMIHASKEIQSWLDTWNIEREMIGQARMDVRIGIHMGPVAAGVIGSKKFAYDIWGDTVNMAARLEQSGERGKINISGEAYEKVKDKFKCTYRGQLPAKNKGLVDMYFVDN